MIIMEAKKIGISRSLLIHPGEAVADVLEERSIAREELAARIGLPVDRVEGLIHGKEDISEPIASALERALNIPESFWLNLQANYEKELSELSAEKESPSWLTRHSTERQPHSHREFALTGSF